VQKSDFFKKKSISCLFGLYGIMHPVSHHQIQCHCGKKLNFNFSVTSVIDYKSASKEY